MSGKALQIKDTVAAHGMDAGWNLEIKWLSCQRIAEILLNLTFYHKQPTYKVPIWIEIEEISVVYSVYIKHNLCFQ